MNCFVNRLNRNAALSKSSSKKSPYLRLKDGTQEEKSRRVYRIEKLAVTVQHRKCIALIASKSLMVWVTLTEQLIYIPNLTFIKILTFSHNFTLS